MKICYCSSAGGHLSELNEIAPFINCSYSYYVTVEKEDSRSILVKKQTYFLEDTERSIKKSIINIYQSYRVFMKEKPDVVITTGAGFALATCIFAKMFGKKVIVIESLARVQKLSLFGKLVYHLSDLFFVQWLGLVKKFKKAIYLGTIFSHRRKVYRKKKQVFVTVGVSHFPFDRMIRLAKYIQKNNPEYRFIYQIGHANEIPSCKYERFINHNRICKLYEQSEIVICHAGVGSIINALRRNCTVYLMPRRRKYLENSDDHQLEIVNAFCRRKLTYRLKPGIKLKSFDRKVRGHEGSNKIITKINGYLSRLT